MTRPVRVARNIAIGLAAVLIVLGIATVLTVRTDWFRNYVRQQIVSSVENAIGGKAAIASFDFDVSRFEVTITQFVIHGLESADAKPLFRTSRVQLHFRLFTSIHHIFDITKLIVDSPQLSVIRLGDGRTNIPSPKTKSDSKTNALETVVDLAVGHFELNNGLAVIDTHAQPVNLQANNFHAVLDYNILKRGYEGRLELQPVYVVSGRNTPVTFTVIVPVTLENDRVELHHATLVTPLSAISIDGSIVNIGDPTIGVHMGGHVAVIDAENLAGIAPVRNTKGIPSEIQLDANARASSKIIEVIGLQATLGSSNIEASGKLKDPSGKGSLEFKTQLALGELGRLAKLDARPEGTVIADGTARLDAAYNFDAGGNIHAEDVAFHHGQQQLAGISLVSAFHADTHNIELQGLRLNALGGEFEGKISLAHFERYNVEGNLRRLDIKTIAAAGGNNCPSTEWSLALLTHTATWQFPVLRASRHPHISL